MTAISVIVPTYDRPRELARCLDALAAQRLARSKFEVIVVDDGGRAALDAVVTPFAGRLELRLVRQRNRGPGAARNRGADEARGRYLAFTDDDCAPDPGWLVALSRGFERAPSALLGGATVNLLAANPFSTASQLIADAAYRYYNSSADGPRFFASNNLALPADRFRALGGFDPRLRVASEDRELCDRWRFEGGDLRYEPTAVVRHGHALGLRSFARQHFQYGRGSCHFHRVRAARRSGRFAESAAMHTSLVRWLQPGFARLSRRDRARVAPLIVVWQLSNAAGFVYEVATGPRFDRAAP